MYVPSGNSAVEALRRQLGTLKPGEWTMLVIGSVLGGMVGTVACAAIGVPHDPGFGGSLFAADHPVAAVMKTIVVLAACLLTGGLVLAFAEAEAGLVCGGFGLAAVAVRCGPIRPVLIAASGPAVYVSLTVELLLLAGLLGGGWALLRWVFDHVRRPGDPSPESRLANEVENPSLGVRLSTFGTAVLATAVCLLILVPTADKSQALGGVGVAAFLGVIVAYTATPLAEGVWYWAAPAAVGVVGYLVAAATGAPGMATGDAVGYVAALARPTPLDYASVGTAAAMLGYWTSRRMYEPSPDEAEPASSDAAEKPAILTR